MARVHGRKKEKKRNSYERACCEAHPRPCGCEEHEAYQRYLPPGHPPVAGATEAKPPDDKAAKAAKAEEPQGPTVDKFVTYLLAGVTSFVALLTTLGAATGGLERMFRNYPGRSLGAFLLVLGATTVIVLVLVLWHERKEPKWWNPARAASIVLATIVFVVGVSVGIALAVHVPSMREKPRIQASLATDPALLLTATVDAGGVSADTSMQVQVDGWNDENHSIRLLTATVGPSTTGEVHVPVTVPLPPGRYEWVTVGAGDFTENSGTRCTPFAVESSCYVVSMPERLANPAVTGTWKDPAARLLTVHLVTADTMRDSEVFLSVTAEGAKGQQRLFVGFFPPSKSGVVDQTIEVEVGAKARSVCVFADTDTSSNLKRRCTGRAPSPGQAYAVFSVPKTTSAKTTA